jgi:hypothetical protein
MYLFLYLHISTEGGTRITSPTIIHIHHNETTFVSLEVSPYSGGRVVELISCVVTVEIVVVVVVTGEVVKMIPGVVEFEIVVLTGEVVFLACF